MNMAFPLPLRSLYPYTFHGRIFNSHTFWNCVYASTCIHPTGRPNSVLCYSNTQKRWQAVSTTSHTTNWLGISVVLLFEKPASWLFCKKQSRMIVARESVLYFWESASTSLCLPCHSFSYHQGQVSVVSVQQRGNIIHWWLIWGTNTEKGPACLLWTQKLSVWCWEDRCSLVAKESKLVRASWPMIYNTKSALLPKHRFFFPSGFMRIPDTQLTSEYKRNRI